jgi:2-phospho-L-lactate guanylyltransferase
MVEDVLTQLHQCQMIDRVVIVSDDPVAELLAERHQATYVAERGRGLNAAVQQGVDYIAGLGGGRVLILHGDIPLLQASAIGELLGRGERFWVVTDAAQQGSNLMLCDAQADFHFQYGVGSLACHLKEAERLGWSSRVICQPDLALDIDEPQDMLQLIERLQQQQLVNRTARYLADSGVAQRLQQMQLESDGQLSAGRAAIQQVE